MPDEPLTTAPSHASGFSPRTVLVIGYTAMIGAFFAFVAIPFCHERSTIREQLAHDREEITARVAASRSLTDLNKQVELVNLRVKNYDRLVPANLDFGPFLEETSHTLDAAGMKEVSFRALPAMILGKSQQLPIEVSGICTYPQFRTFLEQMESLPRMSSVSHLIIESDAAMTSKVAIDLTLSIYNTKPAN